jgi:hypothetical protein
MINKSAFLLKRPLLAIIPINSLKIFGMFFYFFDLISNLRVSDFKKVPYYGKKLE